MYSRWFNAAVVLLWLTTMAWLVVEKVLPPLLVGDPPNVQTVLEAQRNEPPVGWSVALNDEPLGWAVGQTQRLSNETTQINTLVQFDRISLAQILPAWARRFVGALDEPLGEFSMQAESTLIIDPLGRLTNLESQVRFLPLYEVVFLQGTMEGNTLKLRFSSGTMTKETEIYMHSGGMMADAFSPQSQLPGLKVGQRWTVPVYSPLRPVSEPLEILEASVERREPVLWRHRAEDAWLVVYRAESGTTSSGQLPRGRLWVRDDGTVIRQELTILGSTVVFERLPEKESVALAERAQKEKKAYLANMPMDQLPREPLWKLEP